MILSAKFAILYLNLHPAADPGATGGIYIVGKRWGVVPILSSSFFSSPDPTVDCYANQMETELTSILDEVAPLKTGHRTGPRKAKNGFHLRPMMLRNDDVGSSSDGGLPMPSLTTLIDRLAAMHYRRFCKPPDGGSASPPPSSWPRTRQPVGGNQYTGEMSMLTVPPFDQFVANRNAEL